MASFWARKSDADSNGMNREVESNLEENLKLAQRWGCILLLDEADVFLQARDKEDLRRNAVVSVFLRVLEFYSGILFLTSNKVGHFDEAFKSRIHLALYYPPLDKRSTLKIWQMNLQRTVESRKNFDVDREAIEEYAKQHFKALHKQHKAIWNGRQIKNAFQTAIALAEFEAKTKKQAKPVLTKAHFEIVAKATEGFDEYLARIHGPDADRARREGQRDDDTHDRRPSGMFTPMAPRPSKKLDTSESSSSSEDSEAKEKRKRKEKKAKKKKEAAAKALAKAQVSDSNETSSS